MFLSQKHRRKGVILLAQIIIFVGLYMAMRAYTHAGMAEGPAPQFKARTLDGSIVSLEEYQGQPMLLHFWATWCPICELEMGGIDKLTKDLPVLTVAMQSGSPMEVQAYMEEHEITSWVTIADEFGDLANAYGVKGTPASYIIDSNGDIAFREMGFSTSWGLRVKMWLAD